LPNCCGKAANTGGTGQQEAGCELVVADGGAFDSVSDQIAIQTIGQIAAIEPVAEVEQAAFGPSNVVPGISFSPDRMLQARLFSYNDTVRYRLGVNFYQIPINAP
jgi:hypothetical protein